MRYHCIIGIDPGLMGGVACLSGDGLMAKRMPVIKAKKKTELDVQGVITLLTDWDPCIVYLERQQTMPGQGVASSGRTMMNYGILIGILAGMGIPYETVPPATWKRTVGVVADKVKARAKASALFPKNSQDWSKACEDGVAEAALIAEYGWRQLNAAA